MPDIYYTPGGQIFGLLFLIAIVAGIWSSFVDHNSLFKNVISFGWKFPIAFLATHVCIGMLKVIDPWDPDLAAFTSLYISAPLFALYAFWSIQDWKTKNG